MFQDFLSVLFIGLALWYLESVQKQVSQELYLVFAPPPSAPCGRSAQR